MDAMRLSDDKARRLTRLVWRDRAKRALPLVLAAALLFAAVAYFTELSIGNIDRTIAVQQHPGTIVNVKQTSPRGSVVLVHLGDGRDVEAFSSSRIAPHAGEHVLINEARHASGRSTYEIAKLVD
jgi:hypothetical protein